MYTANFLARHSIDINDIILEYIQKFKISNLKVKYFLDQVQDEFQEKIQRSGATTIDRSVINVNEILISDSYKFIVSIKKINSHAFANLKKALKKISA